MNGVWKCRPIEMINDLQIWLMEMNIPIGDKRGVQSNTEKLSGNREYFFMGGCKMSVNSL